MAGRESKGSNIEPGVIERVAAGIRFAITGQAPAWFGPMEPLTPVAPPETAGRQFDYMPGYNISAKPRQAEQITFHQLRALADNYDLMRLVIETRKDQLAKCEWAIQPKDKTKKAAADPRVAEVTDFLASPDKEHDWDTWLRMLIEDMLVIDAATIYPRKTLGGKLYALEPVDGATITRLLDDHGRTPVPPQPAFQQVLKGLPAVDYTRQDLLYLPRNMRTNRVYGMSPVEQVVMTVNIAIRRQLHQLQYYTEGNVPEALIAVPETWTPDQVAQFQAYWDALNEGDTAQRRHARFVPATIAKGYVATKDAALKDEYDEWLARIICYAFSVSSQWAVKQMNRATSDSAQEQALQEGLGPLMKWVKSALNRIICECFGYRDLEFTWKEEEVVAPEVQAQIDSAYVGVGVVTRNEVRGRLGLEPLKDGDVPMIIGKGGAVTVDSIINPPPPPPQLGHNGGPPLDDEGVTEEDGKEGIGKLAKAAIDRDRSIIRVSRISLGRLWTPFLSNQASFAATALGQTLGLTKAEQPSDPENTPSGLDVGQTAVASEGLTAADATAVDAAIDMDAWNKIVRESVEILREVAVDGIDAGANMIGLSAADVTALANPRAVAWAEAHAADLVGDLTDTTRQALRNLIVTAERDGWGIARLEKAISDNYAFSSGRARLIAVNETACADMQGNLLGWQAAEAIGIKLKKRWIEGLEENHCAACDDNVRAGAIALGEAFPSGHQAPTAHPHCDCDMVAVVDDDAKKWEGPRAGFPFDLQKSFNPGQPRDVNGKWTSGGGYDAASEISRGQAALHAAVSGHRDIHDAMAVKGIGQVAFIWGAAGDANRGYAGGYGLAKIIAKHGQTSVNTIPTTLAHGQQDIAPGRIVIRHEGHRVILTHGGKGAVGPWVLSAYEEGKASR